MSTEMKNSRRWTLFQELESLGINVGKINDLNDLQEFENLIENIKQTYFQDYKTCYDDQQKEEIDCMIPFNNSRQRMLKSLI
jgi:hypothetical protein